MGNFTQGTLGNAYTSLVVSTLETDGKESSQYEHLVGRARESI